MKSLNKKIKIGLFSILGIAFLLFAVLIVHIAVMVHQKGELPLATVQMARADFQAPIDSVQALQIQHDIQTLNGVKSTYFNVKDDIVIYTFDNRRNTAQDIFDKAIKTSGFPVVRYTVSEKDLAKGCPVMNDNSFYGKLTAVVSKFVN